MTCRYRLRTSVVMATILLGIVPSCTSETTDLPLAPKDVGRCIDTTITRIGERLQSCGPGDCGMSIIYANGGYQVDYVTDWTVHATWRINDPVRFCLESITPDCLTIDDPSDGRFFVVTNLRTNYTWRAASSQTDCFIRPSNREKN